MMRHVVRTKSERPEPALSHPAPPAAFRPFPNPFAHRLFARGIAATGLALALSGCQGVLSPAGPIADQQRTILLDSVVIMLCIVVPVCIAALAFAYWFRADNPKARRDPTFVFSGKIELVVWSTPALVIAFLGSIAWMGSHALDPYAPIAPPEETMVVQVVATDWKWLFIYPEEGVASVNRLVVPADKAIRFRITSSTVMNAFFVPRLGSMIYAMNGMETTLHLAGREGTYRGISANFSGDGFAGMSFQVEAVPQAKFDAWVSETKGVDKPLDAETFTAFAQPSQKVEPFVFGSVDGGLFDRIVSQDIPPIYSGRENEGLPPPQEASNIPATDRHVTHAR